MFHILKASNMSKQHITTINGVEIFAEIAENGNVFVPIKPICTALGIDDKGQRDKIQEDDILASVGELKSSTGADGKQYEMYCLPLQYVYGWIFTINPKNVAEFAKEAVKEYRRECYDALYAHFAGSLKRQIETNEAEISALKAVNEALAMKKQADEAYKQAQKNLEKVRAARLDNAPYLDLYK